MSYMLYLYAIYAICYMLYAIIYYIYYILIILKKSAQLLWYELYVMKSIYKKIKRIRIYGCKFKLVDGIRICESWS